MARTVEDIKLAANEIRRNILKMTYNAGANGGHIGGALSCADILAVLYAGIMRLPGQDKEFEDRDRFFLSKGHVSIAHYATLIAMGLIPQEHLELFEVSGGDYPTHEVMNEKIGIETSSGSLGYGLSIGVGSALAAKLKNKEYRIFVLLGDGECNEGSVWEAVMAAARYNLDNLIAIVDVNNQSLDGLTKDIMPVHSFSQVFEGFGWNVVETDGNDIACLISAFDKTVEGKPTVILANTLKVKGISSIEGQVGWHHARLTEEQYHTFLKELEVEK